MPTGTQSSDNYTKNVDEALSKVRELYAAVEKANAAATALAKMLDGLTVRIDYV